MSRQIWLTNPTKWRWWNASYQLFIRLPTYLSNDGCSVRSPIHEKPWARVLSRWRWAVDSSNKSNAERSLPPGRVVPPYSSYDTLFISSRLGIEIQFNGREISLYNYGLINLINSFNQFLDFGIAVMVNNLSLSIIDSSSFTRPS